MPNARNTERQAVAHYLQAVIASGQQRRHWGRRTLAVAQDQLTQVEKTLAENAVDPIKRLDLLQQRRSLNAELAERTSVIDVMPLEDAFVAVAASYSSRKGIEYDTWREIGVEADVLLRAGITRSQPLVPKL